MLKFKEFILEAAEDDGKLKHIHHAEDRPLLHGAVGFNHAIGALNKAHEHIKRGEKSSSLTMKYDGSPAVVFGHHPQTGRFFVASKSAFNKTPKINYSHEDVDRNHGHAPGLAAKLHASLDHLHKIVPKKGVYQGDLLYHQDDDHSDVTHHKGGHVSFTPNTITYTARGEQADKIRSSRIGVVVHTKYHGNDVSDMRAHNDVDADKFKNHPDVYHHTAEHDTSQVKYPKAAQAAVEKHLAAAKAIHDKHGKQMYDATEKHHGEGNHLVTYINHTVRHDEVPSVEGFRKHVNTALEKAANSMKSDKGRAAKIEIRDQHLAHIDSNRDHYSNLLQMHHHLQQAKNTLVSHLEGHEGGYEHHIDGKSSKPEGFVVHHDNEPTKLVNRAEFAKQNLLKVRK